LAEPLLCVKGVWKSFGRGWVLRDVNLVLRQGEAAAIMGPNGSGKTTLLRIIACLIRQTRGEVTISGLNNCSQQCRMIIGLVMDHPLLYRDLTVRENLRFYASLYGVKNYDPEADPVVEALGLRRYLDYRVNELSYGWRRRSDIARALLHRPRLLLIDEPFNGLDPEARQAVEEMLEEHVKNGGAAVMTSPSNGLPLADWVKAYRIVEGRLLPLKG